MKTLASQRADYRHRLEALLGLSQTMLHLARTGQWASLAEAEQARQSLLRELAGVGVECLHGDDEQMDLITKQLQAILDMNADIIEMGQRMSDGLSRQLREIVNGRSACKAYLDNTG